MKFRNIALSGVLAMMSLTLSAQEETEKTEYVFNPHWYGQLQVGGQYTIGETSFGDLISPNVQIAAGYQFTSVMGLRLSVNAWQSKAGMNLFDGSIFGDPRQTNWRYFYVAPGLDATVSLTNLFCGFNPKRLVDVGLMAGIGANIGFKNNDIPANIGAGYQWSGAKVRFTGRMGANLDFRINDRLKLGLELQANVLNDHYNSKRAGNPDWYVNALVGVRYAFGKTNTARKVVPPAPRVERVIERIVEKPAPAPAQEVKSCDCCEKKCEPLRRDIFFSINSTAVKGENLQKVKDIAAYLNKYPEAKVTVTGYADKATGTAAVNDRVALKRANSVADALVADGISRDRIIVESKGSREQPFADNAKNRVSICVAE